MPFSYQILIAVVAIAFLATVLRIFIRERSPYAGRRVVTCPETKSAASVEVDRGFAWRSVLRDFKRLRLQTCSRWPDRAECEQNCVVQIEATPEVLTRIFKPWYAGKSCARCDRPLDNGDWQQGRACLVDAGDKVIDLRHMKLADLPGSLENCRPLCLNCAQAERARRPVRTFLFKGDRSRHADDKFVFRD